MQLFTIMQEGEPAEFRQQYTAIETQLSNFQFKLKELENLVGVVVDDEIDDHDRDSLGHV